MNAYTQPIQVLSGTAATDMSAKRFTAVTRNADGQWATTSAGAAMSGVIIDEVEASKGVAGVVTLGSTFAVFGATVAAGEQVEIGTAGKFIPLAAGIAVGICEVGGAADEIGTIVVK